MNPQQHTSKLIRRILADNPEGLSAVALLGKMLQHSENNAIPLYLGPGYTVRSFIDRLAKNGCVKISSTNGVTLITPLQGLRHRKDKVRSAVSA
jgi:hypothetical protein